MSFPNTQPKPKKPLEMNIQEAPGPPNTPIDCTTASNIHPLPTFTFIDPSPKFKNQNNNNNVITTHGTVIYKANDPIPKRLLSKQEIIKGYVIFLLVSLLLAVFIFIAMTLAYYSKNKKNNEFNEDLVRK